MDDLRIASTAAAVASGESPAGQAKAKAQPRESASRAPEAQTQAPAGDIAAAAKELGARIGMDVELTTDEKTGSSVVRISTPDGKRLVRQVPPEGVLKILERLAAGKGLFEQSI